MFSGTFKALFRIQGSQYDNFGGLINWWSKPSLASFQKKADCMVKQYDKYVAPGTTTNVSGLFLTRFLKV